MGRRNLSWGIASIRLAWTCLWGHFLGSVSSCLGFLQWWTITCTPNRLFPPPSGFMSVFYGSKREANWDTNGYQGMKFFYEGYNHVVLLPWSFLWQEGRVFGGVGLWKQLSGLNLMSCCGNLEDNAERNGGLVFDLSGGNMLGCSCDIFD